MLSLRRTYQFLSLSLLLGGGLSIGCTDDALITQKFCNLPARFAYTPVSAISQLYSACNSLGEWCTITTNGKQFVFANPRGSTPVNRTAVQDYAGFYMGLSGFLVGLPNIPELGTDHSALGSNFPVVTCYDLACRNCYDEAHVTKRLVLQSAGFARCEKCQRIYNLNDQGLVTSKSEPGKPLFRYRVYYGNNTLSIQNR